MPPIPLISTFSSVSFLFISEMKRRAIGFTALPEYPPTADLPLMSGVGTKLSRSTFVMLLTVFIAAMPSAPAFTAAIAGISILVILGVIFASTGSFVPRLTAAVYFVTSSGFVPTSLPIL